MVSIADGTACHHLRGWRFGGDARAPGMSPRPAWLNTRLRTAATPAGVAEMSASWHRLCRWWLLPPLRCSRSAWDRANGPIGCDRRRWWSCCDRRRAVAGRKQRLGARGNRLTDYGGAAGVVGNYLVLGHRLRRWREFLGKALIIRMTRGDVFSIPGRGWQPCVAPYFADRGCRRNAGTSDGHPLTPHPGGGARLSLPP